MAGLSFLETGSRKAIGHRLRRTLPLKEQYSATEARGHKEMFCGIQDRSLSPPSFACVASFMDDCTVVTIFSNKGTEAQKALSNLQLALLFI
jgi:hypothetical protein